MNAHLRPDWAAWLAHGKYAVGLRIGTVRIFRGGELLTWGLMVKWGSDGDVGTVWLGGKPDGT